MVNGIKLETFLKLTKQYGATAVLAAWLFFDSIRLNKLENLLIECYQTRTSALVHKPIEKKMPRIKFEAVLPEKIKLADDETSDDTRRASV